MNSEPPSAVMDLNNFLKVSAPGCLSSPLISATTDCVCAFCIFLIISASVFLSEEGRTPLLCLHGFLPFLFPNVQIQACHLYSQVCLRCSLKCNTLQSFNFVKCCIGPFRNVSEKRHTIGDVYESKLEVFFSHAVLAAENKHS